MSFPYLCGRFAKLNHYGDYEELFEALTMACFDRACCLDRVSLVAGYNDCRA
ncbi:hypothetical protein JCM10512_1151 [Bacteroides reticulotermitis JCM 10512]|uniref:Uncharacterized protein n=1 Tax=Bacteroides reticulotermitis JCM 10512 TaxID=1445607 RepID=W4UP30_9BACE|nr:hypothetical protein JCM10512_1151 [Bacteroides reticulotermitis JCM 10512]